MELRKVFPAKLYLKKVINTFLPRPLFRLSPRKSWAREHWEKQDRGDAHGFDKYCTDAPHGEALYRQIELLTKKDASLLDLGCNCGQYLNGLKKRGYSNLTGIDICENALDFGRASFGLEGVDLICGSFEDVLPAMAADHRSFDLIYTVGATVELVHPSFDIVRYVCSLSREYVVFIISLWGHDYPRFWEYEFNRWGFCLVRCLTPFNGKDLGRDPVSVNSLLVFRKAGL